MIVADLYLELFELLGFLETKTVFRRVTDAMRALQVLRDASIDNARIDLILIQSWNDEIDIKNKNALLFMIRAHELYRAHFFFEAQKYESLAMMHYLNQQEESKVGKVGEVGM